MKKMISKELTTSIFEVEEIKKCRRAGKCTTKILLS